ncbi:efflux RND transporter permease subunit [Rhizobium pusense]|jgi:multidrug efflux pump subunit AcrB|uniref:Cation/multidrug efflux pump n=5 Tax=Bacteria TaxID=2 RepID=U4PWE3_9HYPH|nr:MULTISPECIES: efflux RND transporter permease subunit [Rhizobium/Agrobacterium group]AMD59892.1 ABC transporter permease [Agrobacterium tumefaciens]AUC10398.1 ABC transporter permease [Rhizobium sp. Y9]EKJ94416.1 Acr family transporter [Bradyrhizobium lupini HPC(L)]MBB2907207.1 multidrug efflux pump subunit AcrB [Rhizobium sp. RAS22]MDP9734015.1 multidrug efflux pump subunit AcrB [Rhizobium sp. SORGH_AS_0285]MDP9754156.1 multidrug efflux pump subunit AcrB [Rhizobium sp. SORGH_AS_0260]OAI8
MNFSAWSIRNPIAPLLGFALLMMLGMQAFNTLPITRFPNIDVPVVAVTVTQSGASPSELEMQVTKEIEDAVAAISGVDEIQSTVVDGQSTTTVVFRIEKPTEEAVQDTKDAIDKIRSDLPSDIEVPVVSKIDVEGQAIQTFAVSSPNMTLEELSWFVDDTIKRSLQGQSGIGKVDRYGGADREVRVSLSPEKLDAYGITATEVNSQLRGTNIDLGSGRGQVGGNEQTIRTLGDTRDVSQLANTTIALSNGRFVKLSELGTVTDTYEEQKSFSRFNGNPAVTFAVFRSKGASEVSVAETVAQSLDQVRKDHPDVSIEMVDDAVYFTYGNYKAALDTLIEGAILAVIVVLLFLRNWRATLIAAVALPLSAIPTFWIMDIMGFSLNLVSFLALTLATGILVDDAIVEIENIARHIKMGKTPYRAALEAADEIGLAVIATSFTIIAVFVPVSFMPGIPGQYFIQFGLTVAFSVFFSLAVARLITPLMAAYLMRAEDAMDDHHDNDGRLMKAYTRMVTATTRKWWARYLTLLGAIAFLIASVMLLSQVPGSFLPPDDASRVTLSVELPPNATLDETDRTTTQIYQAIRDINGVESVFILGGASPKGDLELRRATVNVILEHIDHSLLKTLVNKGLGSIPLIGQYLPKLEEKGRTRPQWDVERDIFAQVRGIADVRIIKLNDRAERELSFNFLSTNEKDLNDAVGILESRLRASPILANVSSEGALPRPELQIRPRKDEIARLGITPQQISQTVRVATIGDIDAQLTKISLDDRQIPIRVQASLDTRRDLATIRALKIKTASGSLVPLYSVADIDYSEGPSSIKRNDRNRVVSIGSDVPFGTALDTSTAEFKRIVSETNLPASVRLAESGDAKVQGEMQQGFVNAMLLGLMLVLVVLILLFKDVIQPFTILFSLPLAIGGVAVALIITQNALSMPVLIGILMLMGIVTKNAILLVDFAIEMRRHGMERVHAMVEAGRKRARPIIMTSIAMSAGMLPSALGVGEGGSFRAPMAIAVIGGIIVSTVLSLIVVPAFFLIMDDLSRLLAHLFGRFVGKKEEEEEALSNEKLSEIARENSLALSSLEARVASMEKGSGDKAADKGSNILRLPPLAAE